jgi:hypothetical protein
MVCGCKVPSPTYTIPHFLFVFAFCISGRFVSYSKAGAGARGAQKHQKPKATKKISPKSMWKTFCFCKKQLTESLIIENWGFVLFLIYKTQCRGVFFVAFLIAFLGVFCVAFLIAFLGVFCLLSPKKQHKNIPEKSHKAAISWSG